LPFVMRWTRTKGLLLLLGVDAASSCDKPALTEPNQMFSLGPAQPTLFTGSSIRLELQPLADVAPPSSGVKWSSSNQSAVTVDATGLIKGIASGTSTIRAITEFGTTETTVTVVPGGGTLRTAVLTTCGIATDNGLYCWGSNFRGAAAIGSTVSPLQTPTRATGGLTFTSVAIGAEHGCGMTAAGPFCWGESAARMIGDGTEPTNPYVPNRVRGGEIFTAIETNGSWFYDTASYCLDASCHSTSCGITSAADVYCWDATSYKASPLVLLPVTGAPRVKSVSVGMDHVCAIDVDNRLWCWGSTRYAQTGIPALSGGSPHRVAADLFFQAVSSGRGHTCAIEFSGDAYCWGANPTNQLGAPSSETCPSRWIDVPCRSTPMKVQGDLKFLAIAAGSSTVETSGGNPRSHTCGITVSLEMYCWGFNFYGQLGDGTTTDRSVPTKVSTQLKFRSVTAGFGHTCATTLEGQAYCWGRNGTAELGTGSLTDSPVPVAVSGGLIFK
jgi:alpha-tubulin suppressor-like RCC1 family protein